jgi:hypothetical protein
MKSIVQSTILFLCLVIYSPLQAGFFRVKQDPQGVWWLVDGQGNTFYCKASNSVSMEVAPDKVNPANPAYSGLSHYRSPEEWVKNEVQRLKSWGFNTIGGYSDHDLLQKEMPYTLALTLGGWWVGFPWVDLQTPEGLKQLDQYASEVKVHRDDPLLIGYFVENEMGWWDEALFQHWMSQPWKERLKRRLWDMLKEEYGDDFARLKADFRVEPEPHSLADLKPALKKVTWGPGRRPAVAERFVGLLAEEYYAAVSTAVRKADPNHLLLGDRYCSFYSQPVARAAGKVMDVVTTNYNTFAASGWISPSYFESLYQLCGRPLMVTEYYFAARENDTGDNNLHGPYMLVQTQKERAAGAAAMTRNLARLPYMIGAHWFQFSDEPPKGRSDGEDFNFGLVDVWDKPYAELTREFSKANQEADALHARGGLGPGLVKKGQTWFVPRGSVSMRADGDLKEWDLPRSWTGHTSARQPYAPLGDFYLSWRPDGLYVAAEFFDYSWNAEKIQPKDFERLSLVYALPGGKTAETTISGIYERLPKKSKDPKDKEEEGALAPLSFSKEGTPAGTKASVSAARKLNGLTAMVEARIPAACFGLKRFKAGQRLSFGAAIRLRGDAKETFWPVPLSSGLPETKRLALLELK